MEKQDNPERKYYLRNQETWELHEVTKESYEQYHALLSQFNRRMVRNGKPIGRMMVFGTMSDMNEGTSMQELWKNGKTG